MYLPTSIVDTIPRCVFYTLAYIIAPIFIGNIRVELAHKLNTIFHKPPTKNNSSSEVYNYEKVFLNPNAQQLLRIDLTHSREREREREREQLLTTQNLFSSNLPLEYTKRIELRISSQASYSVKLQNTFSSSRM